MKGKDGSEQTDMFGVIYTYRCILALVVVGPIAVRAVGVQRSDGHALVEVGGVDVLRVRLSCFRPIAARAHGDDARILGRDDGIVECLVVQAPVARVGSVVGS